MKHHQGINPTRFNHMTLNFSTMTFMPDKSRTMIILIAMGMVGCELVGPPTDSIGELPLEPGKGLGISCRDYEIERLPGASLSSEIGQRRKPERGRYRAVTTVSVKGSGQLDARLISTTSFVIM
jgi:hypothetical protein